jgi:hypothetical protein
VIDGDAIDPRAEARLAAEAANGSKYPEKDLLGKVERFVAVAEQIDRELYDHALVFIHQFGVRGVVASSTPLNEHRLATANRRREPASRRSPQEWPIRPRLPPIYRI